MAPVILVAAVMLTDTPRTGRLRTDVRDIAVSLAALCATPALLAIAYVTG